MLRAGGEHMKRLTYYVNTGIQDIVLTDGKSIEECLEWKDVLGRLAEYENLEEQGMLLKLPCKVGDTVWHISERVEKQGRKKVTVPFVDKGIVDNITLGCLMIPQITVCNDKNEWITFDSIEDFGTITFLTQEAAEAALQS